MGTTPCKITLNIETLTHPDVTLQLDPDTFSFNQSQPFKKHLNDKGEMEYEKDGPVAVTISGHIVRKERR